MLGSWVRAPASSRKQPPFSGGCFVLHDIVEHWGGPPISFVMFINLYEHNSLITKLLRTINRATMLCPQHNSAVPSHLIAGCEDNWIIAHFVAPLVSSLRLRRSSPSEFTRRQSSDCRLFFVFAGIWVHYQRWCSATSNPGDTPNPIPPSPTFTTASKIKFCFFDLYRVSLHDCLHVRKRIQICRHKKMHRD